MNTVAQKNELILNFSSGVLGEAKSLFVSTYLSINSIAAKKALIFDNILANNFLQVDGVETKNLKYTDCIEEKIIVSKSSNNPINEYNPVTSLVGDLDDLSWKSIYKGFKEYKIPVKDVDGIKLIKMDPGTSVPLHSHNGKEFILVLNGSFHDEYGEYKKGEMQINDQKIKHNPTASNKNGCLCLSITENDIIFFGKFASILNLFTFIKSFFK